MVRHRELIWEMARRELSERYAGQVFGVLWAIVHPLIRIAVFLFIFGFVFKLRFGSDQDATVYILSGLIPWLTVSEAMVKAPTTIQNNAGLVKQIAFPTEVLPVKSSLATLFGQVVALLILIGYCLVRFHALPATAWLLVVFLPLQILWMMGMSFLLAALGAYFRDLKDFVAVFAMIGVYLAPIIYRPEMLGAVEPVLYFNPFSYMVWSFQDAFCADEAAHPWAWPVFAGLSLVFFYGGYRVFRKVKPYFGNVL